VLDTGSSTCVSSRLLLIVVKAYSVQQPSKRPNAIYLPSVPTTFCGGNALAETKINLKWPLRPETTPAKACLKPQMGSV
jgi:hypothetical protein